MISQFLEGMENLNIYPVISLVIFILLFIVLLVRIFRMDKTLLEKMGELPLDSNNNDKKFGNSDEKIQ
ncbi:MAG: cbb3-type cytochrome c oxidase subunit 3 [Ignavibacteriales bacterium]